MINQLKLIFLTTKKLCLNFDDQNAVGFTGFATVDNGIGW